MRNMSKKTWKLRVRSRMTEMQKLDILLKRAKIPHTYEDYADYLYGQIIVYDSEGHKLWDAVCSVMTYGGEQGFIEVRGPAIVGHCNDVEGWLTAREVTKMWRCRKYAAKNC